MLGVGGRSVWWRGDSFGEADLAADGEAQDRLVEGLHPVERTLGDYVGDLVRHIGIGDPLGDAVRVDQYLHRRHPTEAVGRREETLAEEWRERSRQEQANLALLVGLEEIQDAIDRLGGVQGVE